MAWRHTMYPPEPVGGLYSFSEWKDGWKKNVSNWHTHTHSHTHTHTCNTSNEKKKKKRKGEKRKEKYRTQVQHSFFKSHRFGYDDLSKQESWSWSMAMQLGVWALCVFTWKKDTASLKHYITKPKTGAKPPHLSFLEFLVFFFCFIFFFFTYR